MIYTKPEVTRLGSAMDAIQESMLKPIALVDSEGEQNRTDSGAYASDE